MSVWTLTVRHGSRVEREQLRSLAEAIAALERRAEEIRSAGPLRPRKMLREFEPASQVAGRVEVSSGGVLRRGADAGVDVMGDGTFVAFRGGVRRVELDPGRDGPFAAVRKALE